MLDNNLLRQDLDVVVNNLKQRNFEFDKDRYLELEHARKDVQQVTENLQQQRNQQSKSIGKAKAAGEDIQPLLDNVASLGQELDAKKAELKTIQNDLNDLLASVPNLLHESVPQGTTEDDNVEIRTWGEPKSFDFEVKDHVDLAEGLKLLNTEAATKISGSRFAVLHGNLAKLQRALTQFMLDTHSTEHGYQEIYVPYLVNQQSLFGTGQLPKFEEDLFKIQHDEDDARQFYLLPTAEVPVTNMMQDRIVKHTELPLKFVAHTPCFRSEAGSYGKDTRGLIRQHQFEKVELVQVVEPEQSYDALDALLGHAETILQKLELPYRVVTLCSGDTGFSAAKTYDIEVWLPAQNTYREISSCSNFENFQARRLKARYQTADGKNDYVHTLNGSGLAVGRTLVAILENYQQADGSVQIPDVLKPWMGVDTI